MMVRIRPYQGRTDFGRVLAGFLSDLAGMGALYTGLANDFRDMQSLHSPKRANDIVL